MSTFFAPKFIIPFASFVQFSHKDNFYMNDKMNNIQDVENFIKSNTDSIPVILYPGDTWSGRNESDNSHAIKKYQLERQCIKRMLIPEEISKAVLFFASEQSSGCTAQNYIIDGGIVN